MTRTGKKPRGCAIYFLWLIGALAGCFLAVEIGLRLFWTLPAFQTAVEANDPVYHHSNRPKELQVTHDAQMRLIGKRDSADEYRIFLVGDGFAEDPPGSDPESFCARIQDEFNSRKTGKRAVAYNMAVSSYSPLIDYLVIQNQVLPNDPDLVLMMVDSTDPQDDSFYEQYAVWDKRGVPVAVGPVPAYARSLFRVETAWRAAGRYLKNGGVWEAYEQEPKHRLSHYKDPYRLWASAFARTARHVGRIGLLCETAGTPLVLLHAPCPVVLKNKELFDSWLSQWGFFKEATYTGKNMNRAMWDAAVRAHAPYLNLEPAVLEMEEQIAAQGGANDRIYRTEDGRLTDLAHQALAVAIVTFILQNLPEFKEQTPSKN